MKTTVRWFLLPVLALALPAAAGTWDPAYVWDAGQTAFQSGTFTRVVDWGEPQYGDSIYREMVGTMGSVQVPDRLGRLDAVHGANLDWTGPAGGKVKMRFDHAPEGNRVPPDGHAPNYTVGVPFSIQLGMKVVSGTDLTSYTGGIVTSFAPGDSGYPRILAGGAAGKMDLRWYNTLQTINGVQSNWKPNSASVSEISGNWLMPVNEWANIQLIFDNNTAKTWEAILVRDGFQTGRMKGTFSGTPDAVPSCQYGITSTASNQGVAYDYLAFGWGADHITPEPATLMMLGLASAALLRRRAVG